MDPNNERWMVRMMTAFIIAIMAVLNTAHLAIADDRARLFGIWKLTSIVGEFQDTGEQSPLYGKNPTGYLIFTPEGRVMMVIEGEGRKAPKTDDDRAALFRTMFAYTGMYRLEGDKWSTKVDVSWNPALNGTEQVRLYKFEGDRLVMSTPWTPSLNFPGRTSRGVFTWERAK
jgi:hypothetical protein